MSGSGQLPGWLLTNPSAILVSKATYSSPKPLLYLLPNPMYKKRWVASFWGYLLSTYSTKQCGHRLMGPVGLGQWPDNAGSRWLDTRSTKKKTGPRHCWTSKINLGPYRTYRLWPQQHSNLIGAGLESEFKWSSYFNCLCAGTKGMCHCTQPFITLHRKHIPAVNLYCFWSLLHFTVKNIQLGRLKNLPRARPPSSAKFRFSNTIMSILCILINGKYRCWEPNLGFQKRTASACNYAAISPAPIYI